MEEKQNRCKESIFRDWHNYQCQRKAWKDGYCKQHHPDEVKKKAKARSDALNAKWENQKRQRQKSNMVMVIDLTAEHGFKEVSEYFRKKLEEL